MRRSCLLPAVLAVVFAGPVLAEDIADWCLVGPGGTSCLFGRELSPTNSELWCVSLEANRTKKPVKLASGSISNPRWSPDARSVFFLRSTLTGGIFLSEIRQVSLDSLDETLVAKTSQFACFNSNDDASGFVGASRSKAQPTIILLLRSVRRELTLCEHRAHEPRSVTPVSPTDSWK